MKLEYQNLIRKWSWLAYPILVAILILYSSSFVLSGTFWQSLQGKQSEVEANAALVARLRAKLTRLEATSFAVESDNLNYLLSVQPAAKPVSQLVATLNFAATDVGISVDSFRGTAGAIDASESAKPATTTDQPLSLTTTYVVTSVGQLQALLANLEKRLPLVNIVEVRYLGNHADVVAEGFWSPLAKLATQVDQPLPETAASVAKLRQELSSYIPLPTNSTDQSTLPVSASPF